MYWNQFENSGKFQKNPNVYGVRENCVHMHDEWNGFFNRTEKLLKAIFSKTSRSQYLFRVSRSYLIEFLGSSIGIVTIRLFSVSNTKFLFLDIFLFVLRVFVGNFSTLVTTITRTTNRLSKLIKFSFY